MTIETLQTIFGSIYVLFLPGFALSWAFFPQKNEIDWIERIALSFGLSIAVVPLVVFNLNYLFGVNINLQNITVVTIIIIIAGYLGYIERTKKLLRRYLKRKVPTQSISKILDREEPT